MGLVQTDTVALGLGTNLGDRLDNLRQAVRRLTPILTLERISSIYETEPWGIPDQPWFYNLVVVGRTPLDPESLLDNLKQIERKMGRRETIRYGPRLIDLDLLLYGERTLHTAQLTLPHPRLHERAFVLAPLVEVLPDWRHPRLNLTVQELYARLPPGEQVRYLAPFSQ